MPFRYKRVNIEKHPKDDLRALNNILSQNYVDKGKFEAIREAYLAGRKIEKDTINDPVYRKIAEKYFEETAWDLLLNYVIGVKETSFYLASSYINGHGVNQDKFLSNLTLAVVVKLGDERSIKLLEDAPPLPPYALQFADKCIKEIKKHEAEVKNRDVSREEIMARAKAFDYFVKKNTNHSYCETIHEKNKAAMKHFAHYVEPIIEDNNQYQQPVIPPRANYTPPTITITYSIIY